MIKRLINNLLFCVSTFTKLPVGQVEYTKRNTSLTFLFLPFVGLLLGLIYYGIYLGLSFYVDQPAIIAILLVILNIQLTGGIHFDGFMDSLDAMKSYRDKTAKKRIIKDPRVGAFAVIHFISQILLYFVAFYYLVIFDYGIVFMMMPIISRIMILPLVCKNDAEKNDMLDDTIGTGMRNNFIQVMVLYMFLTIGILVAHNGVSIYAVLGSLYGTCLVYYIYYNKMYKKHFTNLNGDLCGYYIVMVEGLAPLVLVIVTFVLKAIM